jgi:hypothetical protein
MVIDMRADDERAATIIADAFATLDRTEHFAREQTYDPPLRDDSYPTGVDRAAWRQEQERKARLEAQRKAAKAKEQPDLSAIVNATRDETPFTELQMEVIADALSEIRLQLREEIKELRTEVATLRERTGNVTVLPKGKNAA